MWRLRGNAIRPHAAVAAVLLSLGIACRGEPRVELVAGPPPPPTIRPGAPVRDSLAASDSVAGRSHQDTWGVELATGQRIRIELRSPDFDALARLRNPTGGVITSNDDGLGRDAAITFRASTPGLYTILVRSADAVPARGAYTLSVESLDDSSAAPGAPARLAVGDSVTGVLETGDSLSRRDGDTAWTGLVDVFELRTDRTGTVSVAVTSPHFDANLALGDSLTYRTFVPRAGRDENPALLVFRADSGARYRLAVMSSGADRPSGRYHLAVREAAGARPPPLDTLWASLGTLPPALRSACAGGPAAGAAHYDPAAQAIHPTAITLANGRVVTTVPEWAPARRRPVELVLCLVRSRVVLQVCPYNGPDITRFRNRWTASLREAATGKLVHEATITGDDPRHCNYNEAYSLTELSGSLVASDEAFSALRSQFARLVDPSDTTAPLPSRAPARRAAPRNPGGKAPGR